jgi:toxin-antitoxin system PIN domain toxin
MILTDANLLLYAYNRDAPEHEAARRWLEESLSATAPLALSWQTITAFIRISTNIKAFPKPLTIKEATRIVTEWLERPNAIILQPTERHWEIFGRQLDEGQAVGPLVMDAHLAALAIEHGCQLATTDRDFARFSDLKTINPLKAR